MPNITYLIRKLVFRKINLYDWSFTQMYPRMDGHGGDVLQHLTDVVRFCFLLKKTAQKNVVH